MDTQFQTNLKKICLEEGSASLVTIINTKGSTPRKPGAKMLVTSDGQIFGTIGGGCGEAEVRRESLNALQDLRPVRYIVNMTQELAAEEGMVCGGIMEVLIDIIPPGQNQEKDFILHYIEGLENQEEPILFTFMEMSDPNPLGYTEKAFITSTGKIVTNIGSKDKEEKLRKVLENYDRDSKITLVKDKGVEYFIDPPQKEVELIIFGAGHIGLPLANMAKTLGYHVTVIDDRPLFANLNRFNEVDRVICNDFRKAIEGLVISPNTFIVIVTRGHRHDKLCLKGVIGSKAAYIGMIGSKRRVRALMSEIIEEGISPERVDRVYSPIGIDIGAQTPEEIAVSILAQVISVHRGKDGGVDA